MNNTRDVLPEIFSKGQVIYTKPGDLTEGFFGQVFLHLFELLPWLT